MPLVAGDLFSGARYQWGRAPIRRETQETQSRIGRNLGARIEKKEAVKEGATNVVWSHFVARNVQSISMG